MNSDTLLIIVTLILGFVVLYILLRRNQANTSLLSLIKHLNTSSQEDRTTLMNTLQNTTQSVNQRLEHTTSLLASVHKTMGELTEVGHTMKDLQSILASPKLRGTLGEQGLYELLGQLLPPNAFQTQYRFSSGNTVDALILTQSGSIPIDAKFPLQAYNEKHHAETKQTRTKAEKQFITSVKQHIRAISSKYIVTKEGTLDYALMYIPTESAYYDIVSMHEVFAYAGSKRVLPVSPTTLYAYLQVILMSLEGYKIEQQTQQLIELLRGIQHDYAQTEDSMKVLQKHITNAHNAFNTTSAQFSTLGSTIQSTKQLSR
jgi:DNA recombination protein RmuC